MSNQPKIPGAGDFRARALHALHRRLSGGKALFALLAALMLGMSLPAAANECRLADANSNGEHVGEICWFQFGVVDEELPSGTTNAPYEFDLPDGSRVELNVTISGGSAANPHLTVREAPTWTGSNFSGNSGYYTILTPNAAALHSPSGGGDQVELVFSDIRLYAPDGTEVTDLPFEIVVADAERLNSNPQEYLDFGVVSGGSPWTLLEWLGAAPTGAVQQGTPATLDPGLASACQASYVDCLRFKGLTASSNANAVVLSSRKIVGSAEPFTVMGQIRSTAGQGFAVGMRCCELRLRKSLPEGRADPADQFTYSIVNANGDTVSTATTSGSATGAYPFISTMAMSGNALTLVEEMAPGSVSTLAAYERRVVCVNANTSEVLLDAEYDPASPPVLNSLEMGDLVECDISNTPLPAPVLSVEKTADPPDGTEVQPGQTITYTLTTVASSTTTAPFRLVDTLGAGLTFGEVTEPGNFTCSGALDCVLPAGTAAGTYAVTYTATVDADATGTVGNSVTITENGGDPDPECTTCGTEHPITTAVAYDFCPAGASPVFSIVSGVGIWRYEPGATADAAVPELDETISGELNGLMVDPVRNRLLFISRSGGNITLWAYDAGNGGWYQAAPTFAAPDFPRAGMTPDGVGYLVAGNSATPQVWRVTADPTPGSFGYSVGSIGNLSYDEAPTSNSSGDIAFDGNGVGWLVAGLDLYSIDLAGGSLAAVRQTRPLMADGSPSSTSWAGVAFADDGTLYVADNTASSAYYAYDPATGTLTQAAPTGAGASRDLTSCAFPVLAEPELSVAKTLAEVDGVAYVPGAAVEAGDVLTYAITIANAGGTVGTLFEGDVVETLPAGSAFVAAGNDFTCTGSDCPNDATFNIPANDAVTLAFVVEVDDPTPSGVDSIDNAVTVSGVDCTAPGNDCDETTPLAPAIAVVKTADPGDGTEVQPGETITYTLTTTVGGGATTAVFAVTDTLGAGLSFGQVTNQGDYTCSGELECSLPTGTAQGTYALTYTATVDDDATGTVGNSVVITGDGGDPEPECTTCGTEHTIAPPAISTVKSANPADGTEVQPGDTITYTLTTTIATSATTADFVLTDTLGTGLSFGAVVDGGGFTCSGELACTLAAGAQPDVYVITYTATVDDDATGTVGNSVVGTGGGDPDPECTTCATEHTIAPPAISTVKSANPADGTEVQPGDTITYTLTTTIATSATTADFVLTDTLGAGLTFGQVTNQAGFTCSGELVCTLPAGTATGSYAVTYTVTVDDDAAGTVGNSVVGTGGGDPDPECTTCATEHTIAPPAISTVKSADPADGSQVQPGDTITYTLTTNIAISATTAPFRLVDTLGAGLSFGAVTDAGDFSCGGALDCVLPAGTSPGTYVVTYTATVDADATGTVGNSVVVTEDGGDPDPECTTCGTEHTIAPPAISTVKSANPADGSQVQPGDTITYTLTTTIATSATTAAFELTDTLGAGLSFGAVVNSGDFTCSGELVCTLPAGTSTGSYAVTYTATVDADATGSVGNSVVVTGDGGDPDPECTTCATEHTIVLPTIGTTKSADPANGSQVQPGDTITYTLTTTIATSATTAPFRLVDTLGAGLTFGVVTDAGDFSCSGALDCALPTGTLPGTYVVTYTATVDADATGTVGNSVTIAEDGGDPDSACTVCETEHPIAPPAISTVKSASPADGTEVQPGDTITYTLTTTIATSATTAPFRLVDTLGAGLTFGAVTDAGGYACSGELDCTLPAGTLPGAYAVTYTATVDADATGTVGNSVVIAEDGGDPDSACTVCETEHPIAPPAISTVKSADPADGSEVQPGDTLTYTLTATIATSATTAPFRLVDTLGAGLTFGAVTDAGDFACGGTLECTLPAGTLPGTYAVTYTATVDADATGTVGNSVVIADDGGDPDPECTTCATEHTIELPTIATVKTADPADGSEVRPGDTITYTLTTTIATSATTGTYRLVDTLGAGLAFGAVTDAGDFACGGTLECTLPAGTLPGTYAVTYTATVDADATGSVGNSVVVADDGGDPDPECTTCATEHTIELPTIATVKTADPAAGGDVRPGDTITYTLTTTIATSATTEVFRLTDTLGPGLTFGEVTDAGDFACADALVCTLPAGTLPGTYAVTYTAMVDADAAGTVNNSVVGEGGGDPDPECAACSIEHEVELPAISTVKTADPADGSEVNAGDVITYTLTTTVATSATTAPFVLTDTLGAGQTLLADSIVAPAGASCEAAPEGPVCTLAEGALPGSYVFTYQTQVDPDALGAVGNSVVGEGGGDPDPECATCSTEHPLAEPVITIAKTSDPGDGEEVSIGETILYTLSVTIENAAIATPVQLTDTPGAGLTVGTLPAGCTGGSGGIVCTVAMGTVPGVYTFSYPATVDASAVGEVTNAVVSEYNGGLEAVCQPCGTSHQLADEPELRVIKTAG
ncbi:isopeptide-forming domain-containing fimbrial protein, partial [Luteimonas salinilitoris]